MHYCTACGSTSGTRMVGLVSRDEDCYFWGNGEVINSTVHRWCTALFRAPCRIRSVFLQNSALKQLVSFRPPFGYQKGPFENCSERFTVVLPGAAQASAAPSPLPPSEALLDPRTGLSLRRADRGIGTKSCGCPAILFNMTRT